MFEKISQIAEQAATRASRRQFLGRLGRGAAALTGVLAGLLAFPGEAAASRNPCPGYKFCGYTFGGAVCCNKWWRCCKGLNGTPACCP